MQNITALGPANPFGVNLLSALGIMHFSNEEIKETFDELTAGAGSIDKARIFELLKTAFGFAPMPEEMGLFVSTLKLEEPEPADVSWADLEAGMDEIRHMLHGVSKNAAEFNSYQELADERFKHTRFRKDPMDKYKAPMTESQRIGWHEEEVYNERFPKTSCAETKYADAMVLAGTDYL
mmetsp:Transcript_72719/g.115114  ORF Transcript_72719/g.115114 Transcript_72719/m.115114 type:complete len:179 (-) Transcript_72719:80-616(-)|eukprot:CAMPEP_0169124906 /NCGR_PEP_ID=MMETSP1015-20121227/34585_1 /TAXON_ID=342587 /ORGANISM="Karlodinium micrum, Strain CCMP2283" /LENGTH=178 /DNA_ID=CAMNT_0009188375 /DNA_START=98 /DNA_END=634 /DNA_ORIENTATION=+